MKIELQVKRFNCEWNEGTEGVLAKCREASSACPCGNRAQRIKSLKMVVEDQDTNQFSYLYVLNPFLKLTPLWRSLTVYISDSIMDTNMKFWDNLDSSFEIVLLKFGIHIFFTLENCAFRHRWNYVNFRQCFYSNFRLNGKTRSERSCSDRLESTLFNFKIYLFNL